MSDSRDDILYRAKLAEQAERYDGKFPSLSVVILKQASMLPNAYKCALAGNDCRDGRGDEDCRRNGD